MSRSGSGDAGPSDRAFLSPPRVPERLLGLDAARVIATLGVVWFHSLECGELRASGVLGRFSVAFYTLAGMVFLVQSADRRRRPAGVYVVDRLRRLGIPFFGWGIITVAVMYGVVATGYPLDLPAFSWNMLADGGTLHLWYLPFLFVASIVAYPLALYMGASRRRRWILAAVAMAIALALDCGVLDGMSPPKVPVVGRFLELTDGRWSAVYWGFAAAVIWSGGLSTSRWRLVLAIAGAALLVAVTAWQWHYGLVEQLKVYGGLGLLALSLGTWNNRVVRFLAPLGRMSAGVYFAHMAAIYAVRDVYMFTHASRGPMRDVIVFGGATVLSFAIVAVMAAVPGLQWLAGYESARRTQSKEKP